MPVPAAAWKPMTAADVFDTSVGVFRAHARTLAGIGILTVLPLAILPLCALLGVAPLIAAIARADGSRELAGFAGLTVACSAFAMIGVGAIAALFQSAAVADATAQVLHGAQPSLRLAYRRAFRHWTAILVAAMLIIGANIAAGLLGIVPLLGFVVGMILQSLLNALFGFVWQAIVIEDMGGVEAVRRSWQLARAAILRVVLAQLGATFLVLGLGTGPGMLALSLAGLLPPWIALALFGALAIVLGAISAPLAQVVATVLYYDLRMRQEGYDLHLQAEQLMREAGAA